MPLSKKLESQIALLPTKPGVYLMKDADDNIIYVGKAKNLKNRVSQYFLRPQSGKVFAMVTHVDHFDFIIVHNEKEAFILEMNLIQTHYPRYNIMLMDDSFYYDENGVLQGVPHPNPDYLYPNLFYQGVTRVQEKLALIVLKAPELFLNISSIVQ